MGPKLPVSAEKSAFHATEVAGKKTGLVMASIASGSLSSPTRGREERASHLAEIRAFWRQFFARAFDPYRPELHYMRGPGPACRAKQAAKAQPRPN